MKVARMVWFPLHDTQVTRTQHPSVLIDAKPCMGISPSLISNLDKTLVEWRQARVVKYRAKERVSWHTSD